MLRNRIVSTIAPARLDEAIHAQELWVEDYVLHEREIEEVNIHD